MSDTIIQQGTFTSTGANLIIPIRSGVSWMEVYDATQAIATPAGGQQSGCRFYWQQGMAAGQGLMLAKVGAVDTMSAIAMPATTGFTVVDMSIAQPGAPIAIGAGTNVTQPVYTAVPTGLTAGAIVRISGTGQTNLNGLDFSVDTIVPATSFRLANTLATAPGAVAGAAGFWRLIAPNVTMYNMLYPSKRVIANITAANPAVVTTLVDHTYTTGQKIRLKVPAVCGMTEISGIELTVTNINASTFSVNIDATAFTAFVFPTVASTPFTPAEAIPVGETPNLLLPSTLDAMTNLSEIGFGMLLGGGLAAIGAAANGPAGINGDVMYWKAGNSFTT